MFIYYLIYLIEENIIALYSHSMCPAIALFPCNQAMVIIAQMFVLVLTWIFLLNWLVRPRVCM